MQTMDIAHFGLSQFGLSSLSLSEQNLYNILVGLHILVVSGMCLYGFHRFILLVLFRSKGRFSPEPAGRFARHELPHITVQLPMFNEGNVAERIIDAACKLDYPSDHLQIQVLDDSTDRTTALCRNRVAFWQDKGVDVELIHRTDRSGFKAGALEAAMPQVTGEFIAVFDADFVPEPGFLKRSIHHFKDPDIGLVQTRWEHLNREQNLLTRIQAIFLDGHFLLEHTARHQSGRWIHFNGTGGIWRKQCMQAAGGWSARTLSEDFDLSTRAQLLGWKLVMDPTIDCPAELPPEVYSYKTQQHRWAKGTTQCLLKLYPKILLSKAPLKVKAECFFQFTWPMAAVFITLSALLPLPTMLLSDLHLPWPKLPSSLWSTLILGPFVGFFGSVAAVVFYAYGQRVAGRSFFKTLWHTPLIMAAGYGIALTNTRGVLEALLGHESGFVRTPKYSDGQIDTDLDDDVDSHTAHLSQANRQANQSNQGNQGRKSRRWWHWDHKRIMPFVELGMGCYMAATMAVAAMLGTWFFVPIAFILMIGYVAFGTASLSRLWPVSSKPSTTDSTLDAFASSPLPTIDRRPKTTISA